jgi:hypothetical protein
MNLFKDTIYFILSLQEKILKNNLKRTISAKNSSKRKRVYSSGCLLTLDTIADDEKIKLENEISTILKNANYNPVELLKYISSKGTQVFYIENSSSLNAIGESEGFIYPASGTKALYLSLLVFKGFKLKTNEMFILSKGEINKYYFIYHFYNWYSFKHGIAGLDTTSQNLLRKFLFNSTEDEIANLHLSDIYKLKDAIKQDKSAIEFVFKLCRDYEGAKKAFDKLKDNGTNL